MSRFPEGSEGDPEPPVGKEPRERQAPGLPGRRPTAVVPAPTAQITSPVVKVWCHGRRRSCAHLGRLLTVSVLRVAWGGRGGLGNGAETPARSGARSSSRARGPPNQVLRDVRQRCPSRCFVFVFGKK